MTFDHSQRQLSPLLPERVASSVQWHPAILEDCLKRVHLLEAVAHQIGSGLVARFQFNLNGSVSGNVDSVRFQAFLRDVRIVLRPTFKVMMTR